MGLFKSTPELKQVDPGKSQIDFLRAQSDPEFQNLLYSSEKEYRPKYAELNLADIWGYAEGVGGQRGLFDLNRAAAGEAEDIRSTVTSAQRAADISDVENLGTRATEALRASDPETAKMIERQTQMSEDLYARAQGVTPQQQREMEQQVREGYSSRGRIDDNASIWGEVLGRENVMRGNRQEYQQQAGQTFGMLQSTAADPFQAILGRPSGAMDYGQAYASNAQGMLGASTTQLFNADAGINFALQQAANENEFNASIYGSEAGMWGGIAQGVGSMVGGKLAGG